MNGEYDAASNDGDVLNEAASNEGLTNGLSYEEELNPCPNNDVFNNVEEAGYEVAQRGFRMPGTIYEIQYGLKRFGKIDEVQVKFIRLETPDDG